MILCDHKPEGCLIEKEICPHAINTGWLGVGILSLKVCALSWLPINDGAYKKCPLLEFSEYERRVKNGI